MGEDSRALLAALPGCARLTPDVLERLAEASRTVEFPSSAVVVAEGEPAPDWYGIVASGALQLSRTDVEDGIVEYLAEGDVLDPGIPGLPATCSAAAVEPTRCLLVPQSAVARYRSALTAEPAGAYRGDLALFVRRARDLVRSPLVSRPARPGVAARLMTRQGVGSIVVTGDDGGTRGFKTDRDLPGPDQPPLQRRQVHARGGRVGVRTFAEADQAVVEVADTGVGIASDQLAAIFERFRQVGDTLTRSRRAPGSASPSAGRSSSTTDGGSLAIQSTPG